MRVCTMLFVVSTSLIRPHQARLRGTRPSPRHTSDNGGLLILHPGMLQDSYRHPKRQSPAT